MSDSVFLDYLNEPRAISSTPVGVTRILFCDKALGHNQTPLVTNALTELNTSLRKLPANVTKHVQALDSFMIKDFKDLWKKQWDHQKRYLLKMVCLGRNQENFNTLLPIGT